MGKTAIFILGLVTSFCLGFTFKTITRHDAGGNKVGKVTGIGGIFFKSKDKKKLNEWYKTHLGFNTTPYGTSFEWREDADSTKKGTTQWALFAETTKYFDPSTKDFMINYRVKNLDALVEQFKTDSVIIVDKVEDTDYGKFLHILDGEGNKIELWEPKDK